MPFTEIICTPDYSAEEIMNGEISCTDGTNYASSCTFTCDEYFELNGGEVLKCTGSEENGGWDNSKPTCDGNLRSYPEFYIFDITRNYFHF